MAIEYRDTQDVDVPQLVALFRSVGWTARAEQPERLAQLLRGSMFVVSAWDGARLVGFAGAISNGAWHAYVTSVAVQPDHQRVGIGRELVRRLMHGRDGIQFVLHADPPVHPFYAKLGYVDAPEMLKRPRSLRAGSVRSIRRTRARRSRYPDSRGPRRWSISSTRRTPG